MIWFYLVWIAWLISEISLNIFFKAGGAGDKKPERKSRSIIWGTIVLANTAGVSLSLTHLGQISTSAFIPFTGLAIIVTGMALRFGSIFSLGRFFTVDVTIREKHQLKTTGIYSLVRHPSYSGSLLSFLGFGVSLNSWFSLTCILIPVTTVMLYRIQLEEKILKAEFGPAYDAYIKNTARLIPGIY